MSTARRAAADLRPTVEPDPRPVAEEMVHEGELAAGERVPDGRFALATYACAGVEPITLCFRAGEAVPAELEAGRGTLVFRFERAALVRVTPF